MLWMLYPGTSMPFRKGRSTSSCISEVVDSIESVILRGDLALGVFFDIEGAFDNVQTSKVLEDLRAKKVPPDNIKWYGHYLATRFVQASIGETTRCRSLTRGTPQGGILSPLVWNIVFVKLRRESDWILKLESIVFSSESLI